MLLCSHFMNSWINIVCLNFSWAGIGVPLDSQHRLFQPFSHASSSTSQEQEGTGIGLSICQVLIFPIMFSSTCIGGYWQFIYFVLWNCLSRPPEIVCTCFVYCDSILFKWLLKIAILKCQACHILWHGLFFVGC